jgi:SAM-dependent methyltransferase
LGKKLRMLSTEWNESFWSGAYDWKAEGEEWSVSWGSSEAQWFGTIYPRIHRFLPAKHILEIAPGFGRWTRFLIPQSHRFIGIDISQKCVDFCSKHFSPTSVPAPSESIKFLKNDGLALDVVQDMGVDFVFSFDSLVHAELPVFEAYVPQILKKLSPTAVAFIHHSNLANCRRYKNPHYRAESVSSTNIASLIHASNGRVLIQEQINWDSNVLNDCFTVFRRATEQRKVEHTVIKNNCFMEEALIVKEGQAKYAATWE